MCLGTANWDVCYSMYPSAERIFAGHHIMVHVPSLHERGSRFDMRALTQLELHARATMR